MKSDNLRVTVDQWKRYYEAVAGGQYAFEHVLPLAQVGHLPRWLQGYLMEQAALPPLPAEMACMYWDETFAAQQLDAKIAELYRHHPARFRVSGDSAWYRERYLRTIHWRSKRAEALAYRAQRCMHCCAAGATDVHHRHYRLFFESVDRDLEVLCRLCHQQVHQKS